MLLAIAHTTGAWYAAATPYLTSLEFSAVTFPKERAVLVVKEISDTSREIVLPFPEPHRPRKRASAGSQQLRVIAFDEKEIDIVDRGMLVEPR
jgi:hypothetical protein